MSDPRSPGLAAGLFTATQQRLLRLLFGHPDRSFYASELIARSRGGSGAIQRELARLTAAQLVHVSRRGNQVHYQANRDSPIFEELRGIVRKTFGLADVLRDGLAELSERIGFAFVFGSIAKGTDRADSDVDLFVISDGISYTDLYPVLADLEPELGRTINPIVMTTKDYVRKRRDDAAFVQRVTEQSRIFLVGAQVDLDALAEPRSKRRAQDRAAGSKGVRRSPRVGKSSPR